MRKGEDIDIAYKSAKILLDAGVLFCLDYEGDMERMGARNLPFTAGTSVAYGLNKEEALNVWIACSESNYKNGGVCYSKRHS